MEYFRGTAAGKRARAHIDGDEEALVSALNIAEIYHRVLRERGEATADDYTAVVRTRCTVVPVDEAIAVHAARVKAALRLHLADAVAYATARAGGARVVTGDPDFRDLRDVVFIG